MKSTQLRIEENLSEKIKAIAETQKRSFNAQVIWILEQYLKDYEKVNGEIKKAP